MKLFLLANFIEFVEDRNDSHLQVTEHLQWLLRYLHSDLFFRYNLDSFLLGLPQRRRFFALLLILRLLALARLLDLLFFGSRLLLIFGNVRVFSLVDLRVFRVIRLVITLSLLFNLLHFLLHFFRSLLLLIGLRFLLLLASLLFLLLRGIFFKIHVKFGQRLKLLDHVLHVEL